MEKNITDITDAEAWAVPPCRKVLEIRRAHKLHTGRVRSAEALPRPLLTEETYQTIKAALKTLLLHIDMPSTDEEGAQVGHIARQTTNGLREMHVRLPTMESFTYDHSLEWRKAPKGLGLPMQVQLVFAEKNQ